jgi:hypothetical protein
MYDEHLNKRFSLIAFPTAELGWQVSGVAHLTRMAIGTATNIPSGDFVPTANKDRVMVVLDMARHLYASFLLTVGHVVPVTSGRRGVPFAPALQVFPFPLATVPALLLVVAVFAARANVIHAFPFEMYDEHLNKRFSLIAFPTAELGWQVSGVAHLTRMAIGTATNIPSGDFVPLLKHQLPSPS